MQALNFICHPQAKFAASLYWLVFRATEDGEFENIPSQVTSPIQRDSEVREFPTSYIKIV